MTLPSPTDARTSATEWRQISRMLWAGRSQGAPAGTIERGRWFVLVGLDGVPQGRFRSLRDAQAAADLPRPERSILQVRTRRPLASLALAGTISAGIASGWAALAATAAA